MARVEIPITVLNSATGLPVPGASVVIKYRATNANAPWWGTETGGSSSTSAIITDSSGRTNAWADRGAYNLEVTGTGITPYTEPWDAVPGGDRTIDAAWVGDDLATVLGVDTAGSNRRQFVDIPTEESRTGTTGYMPTPDRATVYAPAGSVIFVAYRAMVKENVLGAGRIYLTMTGTTVTSPSYQIASAFYGRNVELTNGVRANDGSGQQANLYRRLTTTPVMSGTDQPGIYIDAGMHVGNAVGFGSPGGGHVVTPLMIVPESPGTYDVGFMFGATGGNTISAKNRRLYVWTMGL